MRRVDRGRWTCALLLAAALTAQPANADEPARTSRIVVILVGPAGRDDLAALVREFLSRGGVDAAIETREAFDPDGTLGPAPQIVITVPTTRSARLYYRAGRENSLPPRELALPNGLDEVGRETIANVVESASMALLREQEAVERGEGAGRTEVARAGGMDGNAAAGRVSESAQPSESERQPHATARSDDPGRQAERSRSEPAARTKHDAGSAARSTPSAADGVAGSARRADVAYEIGLRGLGASARTGSRWDLAAGVELGRSARLSQRYVYRIRLVYEYVAQTTLRTRVVDASLAPTALRAGLDLGATQHVQALALGLGLGVDLLRITPRRVDSGWALAPARTLISPVLRLELRYELTLGPVQLGAAAFADASLLSPRYEVHSPSGALPVATPAWLRPGIALSVGVRLPSLTND